MPQTPAKWLPPRLRVCLPRGNASADRRSPTHCLPIRRRCRKLLVESWSCWLESTSPDQLAEELLEHCLTGRPWPEHLLDGLVADAGNRALFRIVVERLGDLFEPRLCRVYADLFAEAIARVIPGQHADHLVARYERVRRPRKLDRDPEAVRNVFVLS